MIQEYLIKHLDFILFCGFFLTMFFLIVLYTPLFRAWYLKRIEFENRKQSISLDAQIKIEELRADAKFREELHVYEQKRRGYDLDSAKTKYELQEFEVEKERRINEINSNGYIIIDLPDNIRKIFAELLIGFEEFAKLKGYNIKFSIDSSEMNKIAFKFTVISNNTSQQQIREDIAEYIERFNSGVNFDDLPIIISYEEHKIISSTLRNRIIFLENNYNIEKNQRQYFQNLIKEIVTSPRGISNQSTIQILNSPNSTNPLNQLSNNTNMKLIGRDGIITDNSPFASYLNVNFGGDDNQNNELIDLISKIKNVISKDTEISEQEKEEAIKSYVKLEEEIKNKKVEENTYKKALDWGAKIASVGSLVVNLIKLFSGN